MTKHTCPRTKHTCPSELIAAYEWIDSAGEWDEALADPEYAYGAALNAAENYVDVTETDLDRVIEWYRARVTSDDAPDHWTGFCRSCGADTVDDECVEWCC